MDINGCWLTDFKTNEFFNIVVVSLFFRIYNWRFIKLFTYIFTKIFFLLVKWHLLYLLNLDTQKIGYQIEIILPLNIPEKDLGNLILSKLSFSLSREWGGEVPPPHNLNLHPFIVEFHYATFLKPTAIKRGKIKKTRQFIFSHYMNFIY